MARGNQHLDQTFAEGWGTVKCARCGGPTTRWPGEAFPLCSTCRVQAKDWKPTSTEAR